MKTVEITGNVGTFLRFRVKAVLRKSFVLSGSVFRREDLGRMTIRWWRWARSSRKLAEWQIVGEVANSLGVALEDGEVLRLVELAERLRKLYADASGGVKAGLASVLAGYVKEMRHLRTYISHLGSKAARNLKALPPSIQPIPYVLLREAFLHDLGFDLGPPSPTVPEAYVGSESELGKPGFYPGRCAAILIGCMSAETEYETVEEKFAKSFSVGDAIKVPSRLAYQRTGKITGVGAKMVSVRTDEGNCRVHYFRVAINNYNFGKDKQEGS